MPEFGRFSLAAGLFEAAMFALSFYLTLWAWKNDRPFYALCLPILLLYFGISEYSVMRIRASYFYGMFPTMFCSGAPPGGGQCSQPYYCVPLAVLLFEANLLFAIMRTTDRLAPRIWARPFMDALLAVNVDMILDPVVAKGIWCGDGAGQDFAGTGFWNWCLSDAYPGVWFGVPVVNYIGWYIGVFMVTAVIRFADKYVVDFDAATLIKKHFLRLIVILLVVLMAGLLAEFIAHFGIGGITERADTPLPAIMFMVIFVVWSLVVIARNRKRLKHDFVSPDHLLLDPFVITFLIVYAFISVLLIVGDQQDKGMLTVLLLISLAISTVFVFAPHWNGSRRGTPPS